MFGQLGIGMSDRTITRELLRTYGVDRDVPCPKCKYNLRGNTGGRCPECGANVAGYLKKISVSGGDRKIVHWADIRERMLAYGGPTVLFLVVGAFWLAVHISNPPVILDRVVGVAMVIMLLAATDAWRRLAKQLWRRRGGMERLALTLVIWAPVVGILAVVLTVLLTP